MLGVFVFVASWRIVVLRRLVSRAGMLCLTHLWSIKLSLKMRVSSNELFSTLKNLTF